MASKDYKDIITELKAQGWECEKTASGHYRAASPDKTQGIVHFSTSDDPHAYLNTVRDLRKRGFEWPPLSKNEQAGEQRTNGEVSFTYAGGGLVVSGVSGRGGNESLPQPIPEQPEERMDRLFNELKSARIYHQLALENVLECRKKLDDAQRVWEEAAKECAMAQEQLKHKKTEFDKAFESAA